MHDFTLAIRRLLKAPSFAASVVLTLALGIGANTALFSVANSLLFRPLPLPRAEELVVPISHTNHGQYFLCAFAEVDRWRTAAQSFTALGSAAAATFIVTGRDNPEVLRGARVDADYFSTLGVGAALGRMFGGSDAGAPVAVLGYEVWQRRFGGGTDALGEAVVLNDQPHTIIGVLPPGIDLPTGTQIYVPLDPTTAGGEKARYGHIFWTVARLKPGRTVEQADTELKTIAAQMAKDQPAQQRNWTALALPLRNHLFEDNERSLQKKLALLCGAVGFLLLIACANVANLVLLRSLNRERELAIRIAVGADRWQITRQLLTESFVLTALGAALGLGLAAWLTPALFALSPVKAFAFGGVVEHPGLDWRVLGFTGLLGLVTGPLFSLPAAWRAIRLDPWRSIQQGSGGYAGSGANARWREIILVIAISLSLALLTGAGVLAKSYARLQGEPLGFIPRDVLSVRLGLPGTRYDTLEKRLNLLEPLLEKVRAMPGVQQAGITNRIPLHIEGVSDTYVPETGPLAGRDEIQLTQLRLVSPGYLETIGATLLRGRLIDAQDRATTPAVVVINQTFADKTWPGEDPLGKRVRPQPKPGEWLTVVGVIADLKENYIGGLRARQPAWYLAYPQHNRRSPVHLVARILGDVSSTAKAIEAAVHGLDPNQPVYEIVRLSDHVKNSTASEQFAPLLVGVFSIIGLLLVAVGIYGLTACFVESRTKEFAIRLALGATPNSIQGMVIKRGLTLFAIGAALGVVLSLWVARLLGGLLHNVSAIDPAVFTTALLALAVVVIAATWFPARRATKTEPNAALRAE